MNEKGASPGARIEENSSHAKQELKRVNVGQKKVESQQLQDHCSV